MRRPGRGGRVQGGLRDLSFSVEAGGGRLRGPRKLPVVGEGPLGLPPYLGAIGRKGRGQLPKALPQPVRI